MKATSPICTPELKVSDDAGYFDPLQGVEVSRIIGRAAARDTERPDTAELVPADLGGTRACRSARARSAGWLRPGAPIGLGGRAGPAVPDG